MSRRRRRDGWRAGRAWALAALATLAAVHAGAQPPCACPGDCDADCAVAAAELERAVTAIFDPAAQVACPAADADGSGAVTFGGLVYVPGGATVAGFEATSYHDAVRIE